MYLNSVQQIGSKKTNKHKTHKHFSNGPRRTVVAGTNFHPSQGQTGQNGDLTVELNRERPVCPRDGSHFVPGTVPVCPRHRPAENVYVYWFFLARADGVWRIGRGWSPDRVLKTRFTPSESSAGHGLPSQRAPLDTVYPLREHLNNVQRMVSGGYSEGLFSDTVCWTWLRNTWSLQRGFSRRQGERTPRIWRGTSCPQRLGRQKRYMGG